MRTSIHNFARGGFTMLEVLCATALSAMLMVAVMGLVAGLSRHERILRDKSPQRDWQRKLARQLNADFERAWSLAPLSDGFQLTGPLGRDRATGMPTWKTARASYRVLESPMGPVLVRELATDINRSSSSHTEVACVGAVAMELCAAAETPTWQPGYSQRFQTKFQPGPVPNQIRVLVYGSGGQPFVDQLCLVH